MQEWQGKLQANEQDVQQREAALATSLSDSKARAAAAKEAEGQLAAARQAHDAAAAAHAAHAKAEAHALQEREAAAAAREGAVAERERVAADLQAHVRPAVCTQECVCQDEASCEWSHACVCRPRRRRRTLQLGRTRLTRFALPTRHALQRSSSVRRRRRRCMRTCARGRRS